jgi:hypothetical protein
LGKSLSLCALIIAITTKFSWGQESPGITNAPKKEFSTPGIVQSLETLIDLQKKQYKKLKQKIEENPNVASGLSNLKDLRIDPYYLRTLLFYSNETFLNHSTNNDCYFYSFLQGKLFKSIIGAPNNIAIVARDGEEKYQSMFISTSDFFKHVYQFECSDNKDVETLFSSANIAKTVNKISYPIPKTESECMDIISSWRKNFYLPYLCRIPEAIKKGTKAEVELRIKEEKLRGTPRYTKLLGLKKNKNSLNKKVDFFKRNYLEGLCDNLYTPQKFCSNYLSDDSWSKVISGEYPPYKMSYKCKNILNKKTIREIDLRSCKTKFNKDPSICLKEGNLGLPSLFPLESCKSISNGLKSSQLKTNYHDCPGNISNEAITNTHRIIMHLDERELKSTSKSCINETNYSFYQLNSNETTLNRWPLSVCYNDRIKEKEVCHKYIPGPNPKIAISENNVISKIIKRIYDIPFNVKCYFETNTNFNPARLKYENDCFIVFDPKDCSGIHCPKKIYYDKSLVKGLSYKGQPTFDYFPNSYKKKVSSITTLLEKAYKFQHKSLTNLTEITYFFKNYKKGIIHGVGCVEDLLPQFFKKNSTNQCIPMPFIIDGLKKVSGKTHLVIRTALDDVHSPRVINWNYIYSAVSQYRELHPLKLWSFYGIK